MLKSGVAGVNNAADPRAIFLIQNTLDAPAQSFIVSAVSEDAPRLSNFLITVTHAFAGRVV